MVTRYFNFYWAGYSPNPFSKHVVNRACLGQVLLLAVLLVIWTDPGLSADRISQHDWV